MNIKEIQTAGAELDRLIHERPYNAVAVAEQLRRWDQAGLPRYTNEQIQRAVDDISFDLSLIEHGHGSGDGRSHEQILSDTSQRIRVILSKAYALADDTE